MSDVWNYDIYLNCEDFIIRRAATSERLAQEAISEIFRVGLEEGSEEGIDRYPPSAITKIRIHYPKAG